MDLKSGFFHARSLKAGFYTREVLRGLSFRFPLGPTTALVGPGGSGKSTLLRILANQTPPNSGFWQAGKLVSPSTTSSFLQQKAEPGQETLENLLHASNPSLDSPEEHIRRLWKNNIEAVHILNLILKNPLLDLPSHFLRIVELTIFFAREADCLFIDEPESGLDSPYLEWVLPLLNEERRKRPIVFVTHNLGLARGASDTCIFMVDGKIIEQGETAALFHSPKHKRTQYFVTMGG